MKMGKKSSNKKGKNGRNGSSRQNNDKKLKKKNKQRDAQEESNDHKNEHEVNDKVFREQLESNGYCIREMDADGNCMFRAISDQLYGDFGRRHHEDVRANVCNYLEKHENEFKAFVVDDDGLDDEEDGEFSASFQDYVSRMRMNGEWAGNPELVCASRCYGRDIEIFTAHGTLHIDYENKVGEGTDEKKRSSTNNKKKKRVSSSSKIQPLNKLHTPPLRISYHDNDHYNSCFKNDEGLVAGSSTCLVNESTVTVISQKSESSIEVELKRNDVCACGSGKKYKKCCLKSAKVKSAKERMTKNNDNDIARGFKILKI